MHWVVIQDQKHRLVGILNQCFEEVDEGIGIHDSLDRFEAQFATR